MKRFPWHLCTPQGWRCLKRHLNAANAQRCRECGRLRLPERRYRD